MKHLLLLIMAFAVVTAGCSSYPNSARIDAAPVEAEATSQSDASDHGASRPVRIACVQDKSGSAALTRTPQLTLGDLAPLIELLRERGGELAIGIIHASLRLRMARLRIERPPAPPKSAPPGAGNPLDEAEQESARQDAQGKFDKKLADWEADVSSRLTVFHSELDVLLKAPSDSRSSPVWSAVSRGDLFLAESDTSWSQTPARYGVVLSDGEDNTVHDAPSLSAGAIWLIVNGDGKVGSLRKLNPERFESVPAAFAQVVARERRR